MEYGSPWQGCPSQCLLTLKTQFRGLGLGYTFRLGYMPYKTGKGIMYLISRKIEFKFSFQPEKFFFSVKSHFSFLFGVFLAFLATLYVALEGGAV